MRGILEQHGQATLAGLLERQPGRAGRSLDDVADLDLMIAFIGSAMGIGLLSYGLQNESMDAAAGVIARVMFGEFFRD